MQTIKKETKRGQRFICAYQNSDTIELCEVYKRPSVAKKQAFNWCLSQCRKEDGERFRIISSGIFTFSVAWMTRNGLRVETAQNSFLIK